MPELNPVEVYDRGEELYVAFCIQEMQNEAARAESPARRHWKSKAVPVPASSKSKKPVARKGGVR